MGTVEPDDGEVDTFTALYRAHAGAVAAFALRRAELDDAADIVSETFLVAWRRLDEVPAEPVTRPWLYGVARRVLANHRRGARRRSNLVERVRHQMVAALDQVSIAEPASADRWEAAAALRALGPDDRELILLAAWEGLSPAEIAVVLDVPAPTVRTRLHRARRRLETADRAGGIADGRGDGG